MHIQSVKHTMQHANNSTELSPADLLTLLMSSTTEVYQTSS